jgi:hypothetical protein
METLSQVDPRIHAAARRKQLELWEQIIQRVAQVWERAWSRRWRTRVELSHLEVMEDLDYGRD